MAVTYLIKLWIIPTFSKCEIGSEAHRSTTLLLLYTALTTVVFYRNLTHKTTYVHNYNFAYIDDKTVHIRKFMGSIISSHVQDKLCT